MQEITTEEMKLCFRERFISLLNDQGYQKDWEKIKKLDVSKTQFYNWKRGEALPGHSELLRVANLLGCSVDYLINKSVTVKTASADVQAAVKTTGLSEKAVEALQNCQGCGGSELLNTISSLIVSDITGPEQEIKSGFPVTSVNGGGMVQGSGIIGGLRHNLEATIAYEAEQVRLQNMSKENTSPEELERWFEQKRKTFSAQTRLENTGYRLMLLCTTATAEGQQYHETLKAEYIKGVKDRGQH